MVGGTRRMNNTTTSGEVEMAELKYCTKCKRKGHYTHEHKDWLKLFEKKIKR